MLPALQDAMHDAISITSEKIIAALQLEKHMLAKKHAKVVK